MCLGPRSSLGVPRDGLDPRSPPRPPRPPRPDPGTTRWTVSVAFLAAAPVVAAAGALTGAGESPSSGSTSSTLSSGRDHGSFRLVRDDTPVCAPFIAFINSPLVCPRSPYPSQVLQFPNSSLRNSFDIANITHHQERRKGSLRQPTLLRLLCLLLCSLRVGSRASCDVMFDE